MQIQRTKISILVIIHRLIQDNHHTYCWPTRSRIRKLLIKHHKIDVSLFCIDKHLASLKDDKYIKSFRRYGRNEDGTCFNKPSNRMLTKKSISFLIKLGVMVASWLKNHIFQKAGSYIRFSKKKLFGIDPNVKNDVRIRGSGFQSIGDLLKALPG